MGKVSMKKFTPIRRAALMGTWLSSINRSESKRKVFDTVEMCSNFYKSRLCRRGFWKEHFVIGRKVKVSKKILKVGQYVAAFMALQYSSKFKKEHPDQPDVKRWSKSMGDFLRNYEEKANKKGDEWDLANVMLRIKKTHQDQQKTSKITLTYDRYSGKWVS